MQGCRAILEIPLYYYLWRNHSLAWEDNCFQYFITPYSEMIKTMLMGEAGGGRWVVRRGYGGGWDWFSEPWQHYERSVRDQKGLRWEWGLQSWRNFIRDIVAVIIRKAKTTQDRQDNKWDGLIWPHRLSKCRGRCQEKSSPCVRTFTKSRHSARPLSLSPLMLSDPISTGKVVDWGVGCGDPLPPLS